MTSYLRSAAYTGEYTCDVCSAHVMVPMEKPDDPIEAIHGPVLDGWVRIDWMSTPHGNRPKPIRDVCPACLLLPFGEIIEKMRTDG